MLELQISQQEEQNAIQTHRERPEATQKSYISEWGESEYTMLWVWMHNIMLFCSKQCNSVQDNSD